MSMHLVECAANREDIPAATKLVLMAFADSADRSTQIGMPGLEQVQRWSGLGRARAFEVTSELVELGLLTKHRAGRKGHRAEYVVFPEGCCADHQRPADEGSGGLDPEPSIGSGGPDSLSESGSGGPDPIRVADRSGSGGPDSLSVIGSTQGPVGRTPSPTKDLNPPFPPAKPGGDCARPGPTPHANCRGCGTTNRQVAKQRRRHASEARRSQEQAHLERTRAETTANRSPTGERSPDAEQLVADTRRQLRARRTG